MEPITAKKSQETKSLIGFKSADDMWKYASSYVEKHRNKELSDFWNIVLQASKEEISEHFFIREHLWCVYVAGFSAATIAKKFPALLVAHQIEDKTGKYLKVTWENQVDPMSSTILSVFGNKRKSASVQKMRDIIRENGWASFYESRIKSRSPELLTGLPGIGPTLACHLARNLGNLNVVKPDVHLVRLAKKYGFSDTIEMCKALSSEPLGKTDLVLWLASVDNGTA